MGGLNASWFSKPSPTPCVPRSPGPITSVQKKASPPSSPLGVETTTMAMLQHRQAPPPSPQVALTPEYVAFNNSGEILSIVTAFTAVAILAVTTRFYVRAFVLKSVGLDDYTILFSMVSASQSQPIVYASRSLERRSYPLVFLYLLSSRLPSDWGNT